MTVDTCDVENRVRYRFIRGWWDSWESLFSRSRKTLTLGWGRHQTAEHRNQLDARERERERGTTRNRREGRDRNFPGSDNDGRGGAGKISVNRGDNATAGGAADRKCKLGSGNFARPLFIATSLPCRKLDVPGEKRLGGRTACAKNTCFNT